MKNYVALGAPSPIQVESLNDRGYSVIDLPRFSLLSESISSHSDMLFSHICGNIVTSSSYYDVAREQIDFICRILGAELALDPHTELSQYPDEARFNCLYIGGMLFASKRAVSPIVTDICKKRNVDLVHINQGYAACSSAVCGHGIITADPSVYKAVSASGIPALKISEGQIALTGYQYGFIGGASGYCKNTNTLYFNGNIGLHPDYDSIKNFADSLGVNIDSLGDWNLTDCGGLFFFA